MLTEQMVEIHVEDPTHSDSFHILTLSHKACLLVRPYFELFTMTCFDPNLEKVVIPVNLSSVDDRASLAIQGVWNDYPEAVTCWLSGE